MINITTHNTYPTLIMNQAKQLLTWRSIKTMDALSETRLLFRLIPDICSTNDCLFIHVCPTKILSHSVNEQHILLFL